MMPKQTAPGNANREPPAQKKRGRPPRQLTIEAIPLRHPDGTLVTTSFGPEWTKFLCGAIRRLLYDGAFIVVNGMVRIAPQKTDTQQYSPDFQDRYSRHYLSATIKCEGAETLPPSERMPKEDWITTVEAAALSGYNEEYIRRLVRAQKIPARKFGPVWQVSRSALQAYMRTAQDSPDKRRGSRSPT